ncbi:MAG: hypothetical protein NTV34_06825 [Proteobacteria bacterium]|nr:hypothetical protein [Pseudomonadota bacterium]
MVFAFRSLCFLMAFFCAFQVRAEDTIPSSAGSSSAFDRIVGLYNQGHMPEWSDFDPTKAPKGNFITRSARDNLIETQMISLELGDDVVGIVRKAELFPLSLNGQPFTIQMGQDCIANRGVPECADEYGSPLIADATHDSFSSLSAAQTGYCPVIVRFRKALLPSGVKALISIGINNTTNFFGSCDPDGFGARAGEISTVSYVIIP